MVLSLDVTLPKTHLAEFPDSCVVCGHSEPAGTVKVTTSSIGWWTLVFFSFGSLFSVTAPACRGCKWRLHGARAAGVLITILIAAASVFYLWPAVKDSIDPAFHTWARMGVAVACFIPYCVYQVFFPDPFCITARKDEVDYEFRSHSYGLDFAAANRDAEWLKVEGKTIDFD